MAKEIIHQCLSTVDRLLMHLYSLLPVGWDGNATPIHGFTVYPRV